MMRAARRLLPPSHRRSRITEDTMAESSWVELYHNAEMSGEIGALRDEVKKLRRRQHPTDCASARALVVSLEDQLNLGSTLQYLNAALSFAAMDNRTMVLADHDRWLFVPPNLCPSRSWACVFLPLSNCSETDLKASAHVPLLGSGEVAGAARGRPERVLHARAVYELFVAMGVHSYAPHAGCARGPGGELLPAPACPLTWTPSPRLPLDLWRSALAHELFRPNPTYRAAARSKRQQTGFSSASAALHIRRGDKVSGPDAQARPSPARAYVAAMQALVAEVRGVRSIYVATDDHRAAGEAAEAVREGFGAVAALVDSSEHRDLRTHVLSAAAAGNLSPGELSSRLDLSTVALDAVANMALLVDARALAGTWSSTFGKVAQYTRVGRRLLACGERALQTDASTSGDEVTGASGSDGPAGLGPEEARAAWADCVRCSQAYVSLDVSRFADFDPL